MRKALTGIAMLILGVMIGAAPRAVTDRCVAEAFGDTGISCTILLGLRVLP